MAKSKNTKGISFLLTIGKYGGFSFWVNKKAVRLCLGWVALVLFFFDAEISIETNLPSDKKFKAAKQ